MKKMILLPLLLAVVGAVSIAHAQCGGPVFRSRSRYVPARAYYHQAPLPSSYGQCGGQAGCGVDYSGAMSPHGGYSTGGYQAPYYSAPSPYGGRDNAPAATGSGTRTFESAPTFQPQYRAPQGSGSR